MSPLPSAFKILTQVHPKAPASNLCRFFFVQVFSGTLINTSYYHQLQVWICNNMIRRYVIIRQVFIFVPSFEARYYTFEGTFEGTKVIIILQDRTKEDGGSLHVGRLGAPNK